MGQLVILAGPSCVGKGPLQAALGKFYPELAARLRKLVLYNSRAPRPGERDGVDYYFRTPGEVEELRDKAGFAVFDVRGDLQALELRELEAQLAAGDVFFEGNPFVGCALLTHPALAQAPKLAAFLSPLSGEEIRELVAHQVELPGFLTEVMRRKLLRRTQRQKGILSLRDLENIEKRAGSAYHELLLAPEFPFVIPNHDGEDSENWDAFYYPIGDARTALHAFAALLAGETPDHVEQWERALFGRQ